jgi:hypothetical protein
MVETFSLRGGPITNHCEDSSVEAFPCRDDEKREIFLLAQDTEMKRKML